MQSLMMSRAMSLASWKASEARKQFYPGRRNIDNNKLYHIPPSRAVVLHAADMINL